MRHLSEGAYACRVILGRGPDSVLVGRAFVFAGVGRCLQQDYCQCYNNSSSLLLLKGTSRRSRCYNHVQNRLLRLLGFAIRPYSSDRVVDRTQLLKAHVLYVLFLLEAFTKPQISPFSVSTEITPNPLNPKPKTLNP